MRLQQIIKEIGQLNGNHIRESGDIYISPANIEKLGIYLENSDDIETILITPYLINLKDGALYELHYYEFEIEVLNVPKSNYVEYGEGNMLPKEITNNIKPKVVVSQKDKTFLLKALYDYLKAMGQMTFEQDRKHDERLENAELFYQIF
ncbi:MAG: hypothetical protein GXY86_08070 [Firmicutes bacterium]|jgi:hypothetical protein|nr:hypothetical protein [Bacillota bacterium]